MSRPRSVARRVLRATGRRLEPVRSALALRRDLLAAWFTRADIAVFHEFVPPPWGGGNQFLMALRAEFERLGFDIETNRISRATSACLFNSFNFDFARLRRFRHNGCRMVHRVDGPVSVYRDRDDGTDGRIHALNLDLADVTVFQSEYSLRKHEELGYSFRAPRVIRNAVDPRIFNTDGRRPFDPGRKIRLISTSWSPHPKKGGAVYSWLDTQLDRDRYEYTFVGNTAKSFRHARVIAPVGSAQLAQILKDHDVYVMASRDDACSNALTEALSCGLPAVYVLSGGNQEIAGNAGLGFHSQEEIPALLEKVAGDYVTIQRRISVPSLRNIAEHYLEALRGA